jgi:hypothetical protein
MINQDLNNNDVMNGSFGPENSIEAGFNANIDEKQ